MKPHFISIKDSPSPKSEYVQEFGNLTGGLNLQDADYRLKPNESPEMKNLLWRDGMLRSRKGQRWLSSTELGKGYAAFEKLWHGYVFCHIGDGIYCFDARSEAVPLARETTATHVLTDLSGQNLENSSEALPPLPKGQRSVATGVNELPGATQSRGVTEPQRDRGTALAVDEVCSLDDGKRYYLTGNGETFCWDYDISSYKDPSWFYLTNTNAVAYDPGDEVFHLDAQGRMTVLQEAFNDYGEAIERVYRFPMSAFGGYDRRKNVNSVILTLGAFECENTELTYITDYEERADLTNLKVVPDYEASRIVGTRPLSDRVPAVFRRRPMCRRVLHFTVKLRNNNINEDLELIGAQVFRNTQGRLR